MSARTARPLPLVKNLDEARYKCVFPSCGGICCQNGRPAVEWAELARLEEIRERVLPLLRPSARAKVEREGFVTRRRKSGLPMLGVDDGWCTLFHEGCVLHKIGAEEGAPFRYKPWRCVAFPLDRLGDGRWYVRQWGVEAEGWDLFCLDPAAAPDLPGESLKRELAFVEALEQGEEAWRLQGEAPPR